ncbi:apolipoprotein N-acyltransferase [Coralliovum pocilloporae]|uniref:apolipoprotein N-acyltransferase n=1 Tax=Coralliovum pocilloporae TaxID=3066369 RepID=UPI003306E8BF
MIDAFADRLIILWGWRRLFVAFVFGVASILAFAPFNFPPVLWITLPGLVWLLDGAGTERGTIRQRLRAPFAVGWWFGFGFFTAGLHWMGSAFFVDPARDALLVPFAIFGLPAALAIFWGLATGLARLFWLEGWPRVLSLTLFLFLAEFLRGHILTGFPWNLLGYALAPTPLLMQSASIIGIYGLTFFAILVFAAPAALTGNRKNSVFLSITCCLVMLHAGFGAYRLSTAEMEPAESVRVRIVQPAIAQTEKWKPENREAILRAYLDLSTAEGADKTGLLGITHLIWPEVALPYLMAEDARTLTAIADLLPSETRLLTGAIRSQISNDGAERDYFNSVYVINDDGALADSYDKVHLVPFGEYLPLRPILEAIGLSPIVQSAGRFKAGRRLRPVDPGIGPPVGILICYEAIFPGLASGWEERPGWLLNVTNDAWFGETIGPHQHFAQTRLRAVESGLSIVRAANTGISAVIDPFGRVDNLLSLGERSILDSEVPKAQQATIYSSYGSIFFFIYVFSAVLLLSHLIYRERQGL